MFKNDSSEDTKQSTKMDGSGLPQDATNTASGASGTAPDSYQAPMQSSTREHQIALRAYYKAQQRGFEGGNPEDDWLVAEQEFDQEYLARPSGPQNDEP
jgi:hypothetical protein